MIRKTFAEDVHAGMAMIFRQYYGVSPRKYLARRR